MEDLKELIEREVKKKPGQLGQPGHTPPEERKEEGDAGGSEPPSPPREEPLIEVLVRKEVPFHQGGRWARPGEILRLPKAQAEDWVVKGWASRLPPEGEGDADGSA